MSNLFVLDFIHFVDRQFIFQSLKSREFLRRNQDIISQTLVSLQIQYELGQGDIDMDNARLKIWQHFIPALSTCDSLSQIAKLKERQIFIDEDSDRVVLKFLCGLKMDFKRKGRKLKIMSVPLCTYCSKVLSREHFFYECSQSKAVVALFIQDVARLSITINSCDVLQMSYHLPSMQQFAEIKREDWNCLLGSFHELLVKLNSIQKVVWQKSAGGAISTF